MTDVFFLSGWAGPETLFPGCSGRWRFAAPFLDGDEADLVARIEGCGARTLGGWSTGAHMILKHASKLLPRFDRVVLVAPFLRFGDSLPTRVTQAMAAGMERSPEATARAFWSNCGIAAPPPWQPEWAAPLAAGLRYLLASAAAADQLPAENVLVLHGDADRIVRPAAVEKAMAVLAGARRIVVPGGHYPDPTVLAAHLF
jgi:pimeloyl-ACP methyl ester carboxylesterase